MSENSAGAQGSEKESLEMKQTRRNVEQATEFLLRYLRLASQQAAD